MYYYYCIMYYCPKQIMLKIRSGNANQTIHPLTHQTKTDSLNPSLHQNQNPTTFGRAPCPSKHNRSFLEKIILPAHIAHKNNGSVLGRKTILPYKELLVQSTWEGNKWILQLESRGDNVSNLQPILQCYNTREEIHFLQSSTILLYS